MTDYKKTLSMDAVEIIAEHKKVSNSNGRVVYGKAWEMIWNAVVEKIVHNPGATPSSAYLEIVENDWNNKVNFSMGDMIRLKINNNDNKTGILFVGFITSMQPYFNGGSESTQATEGRKIIIQDYRWLLNISISIWGQFGRCEEDYANLTDYTPVDGSVTGFAGRRCVFNQGRKPNKDKDELVLHCKVPIFGTLVRGEFWKARDMIRYLLSPLWLYMVDTQKDKDGNPINPLTAKRSIFTKTAVIEGFAVDDPADLPGLDHEDFDKELYDLSVEGLNVLDAVEYICNQIGWTFRLSYITSGEANLVFYKINSPSETSRSLYSDTSSHDLHAPARGETITKAVERGAKMLVSATINENIHNVINWPIVLGGIERVETTVELVPAWKDSDFVIPTDRAVISEADLATETDPNSYEYYKKYHTRGSEFKRSVGRLWCLNESGRYSGEGYDRGTPFDWGFALPEEMSIVGDNYLRYGLFERRLLPCLSYEPDSNDSVGYKIEFSFDGGFSWQQIPCSIQSLHDQVGIWIAEPNLAELRDQDNTILEGDEGPLIGEELSYWTSLCVDKLTNGDMPFKDGGWMTRVRITASFQMDQRLIGTSIRSPKTGSPFNHIKLYDFSKSYHYQKRADQSIFKLGELPADEINDGESKNNKISDHAERIRDFNEDASISGSFILDRLWLYNDRGLNEFDVGDGIRHITGRDYPLASNMGQRQIYPEIVQVIHLIGKNQTQLITRDLRYSEERAV